MPYDLFFSYRRHDLDRAKPLLDALASNGLRIFRDETAIDQGASITKEIREGIAGSKLLVAFYSSTYPLSGACQEELISAWLAARSAGEPPQDRVRIINPEPGFDHIPGPLRDLKAYTLPQEPAGLTALASAIRAHADSSTGYRRPLNRLCPSTTAWPRLLLCVQMVDVAKELVETMNGRQELVPVAKMILAELSSSITQGFSRSAIVGSSG